MSYWVTVSKDFRTIFSISINPICHLIICTDISNYFSLWKLPTICFLFLPNDWALSGTALSFDLKRVCQEIFDLHYFHDSNHLQYSPDNQVKKFTYLCLSCWEKRLVVATASGHWALGSVKRFVPHIFFCYTNPGSKISWRCLFKARFLWWCCCCWCGRNEWWPHTD